MQSHFYGLYKFLGLYRLDFMLVGIDQLKTQAPQPSNYISPLCLVESRFRAQSIRFLSLKCPILALESGVSLTCPLELSIWEGQSPSLLLLLSSPLPYPPPAALVLMPVAPPFCPPLPSPRVAAIWCEQIESCTCTCIILFKAIPHKLPGARSSYPAPCWCPNKLLQPLTVWSNITVLGQWANGLGDQGSVPCQS